MKTIKFTSREAYLLRDRLAVADAMLEALTDYDPLHDPEPPYTQDELEDSINALTRELESHVPTVTIRTKVDEAVLVEAIEGATVMYRFADAYEFEQITKEEWAKYKRDARSIERKLKAAGIETDGFPPT